METMWSETEARRFSVVTSSTHLHSKKIKIVNIFESSDWDDISNDDDNYEDFLFTHNCLDSVNESRFSSSSNEEVNDQVDISKDTTATVQPQTDPQGDHKIWISKFKVLFGNFPSLFARNNILFSCPSVWIRI